MRFDFHSDSSGRERPGSYLTVSAVLALPLTAASAFGWELPPASDLGNWVVVLFGLLLWACRLFALCALGIRAILAGRSVRTKHHRNRPSN